MSGSDTKQSQEETILTLLAANQSLQREIAALRRELSDLLARMLCAVNALTASGSDKLEEER